MSIEVLERAQWDIEIIADEIRTAAGDFAAQRFADRLAKTLARLERFPTLGELIEPCYPLFPEMRVTGVQRYRHVLIFFLPITDGIRVIRVLSASRNRDLVFGV